MSAPPPAPATAAPRAHPASPLALFVAFSLLALQGFGGVLAVAQRELVDRRGWLTRLEFVELYAVAQLLPGPNVVNLSLMIGDRYFGLRGAFAAISGMLLAPLLVVLALAASYQQLAEYPAVAGALRGMGAVAAGLILAMALKMLTTLRGNVLGPALCTALGLATLTAIAVFRVPLAWVVIGLGLSGWGLARWRIALHDAAAARAKEVPTDVPTTAPAPPAGRDPGTPG
ncbi:chromate transporter [Thauera sp.]|jgi:chromate transporter|uniref:chromate transporter n=1 Tax=Thauera sp. TaxID=1905334 RepID=UPI002A3711FF|nr:chromate transporter [Thauera sp.]MDX9886114.1 chromate transporter [Thauera sp.]